MEATHSIPIDQLIALAIEQWRLSAELAGTASPAVKYALRKIDSILKSCEIEIRGFDGQPYDPGLAVCVVDEIDDNSLALQSATIIQTVCPMVLYRGNVVRGADVVIARKNESNSDAGL